MRRRAARVSGVSGVTGVTGFAGVTGAARASSAGPARQRGSASLRAGAVVLGLALGFAACGFQAGLAPRGSDGRQVETVGFEVFENDSRRPNLERDLHVALSAAARRWADARLVTPGGAELVVRGRILEVERTGGIRSPDNQLLETGEVVRVEGELFDARSRRVVRRATVGVRVGTTLNVPDAEVDAEARAVSVAAERLILLLFARQDLEPPRADPPPSR